MNLSEFQRAQTLFAAWQEWNTQIDSATRSLGVTFQGRYQPDVVLEVARPAILAYLRRQRDFVGSQLQELGVEVPRDD